MKKRFLLFFFAIFMQQIAFAEDPDCDYLKENWKGYVYIDSPYGDNYSVAANANKDSSPIKFSLQIDSDKYVVGELYADCQNGTLNLINGTVNLSARVYKDYLYFTGYMGNTFLIINLF